MDRNKVKIVPADKYLENRRKTSRVAKDISGNRYGRILVLNLDHVIIKGEGSGAQYRYMYKCKCDCGNVLTIDKEHLTRGLTHSCGCANTEFLIKYNTKHGLTKHRLFRIWQNMHDRCYNKKSKAYKRYGKRGIKIYKYWRRDYTDNAFINFYNWAYSHGYYDQPKDTPRSEMLSIERKDPNGNYTPKNCEWIPLKYQNYNKENTIWLFDGVEWLTAYGAYHKYNLPTRSYIHNKIENGWDINTIIYSILHQDLGLHKENGRIVTSDGFSVLVPNYIKRGEKYDIRKSKRISKKYT